ncbi:class I SAM-dependent methyltransferase [Chloroflexota bacterium]
MAIYSEYDPFARVYNRHWGDHFIPLSFPILESQVFNRIPPEASILDLCCGTGQLDQLLTNRGYQVTGLDGSEEMLRFARENAPAAEFILADARSFRLPDTYHAVISTFDSLNHIMELDELTAVFCNVHAALRPGGLFLFDLNMESGYGSTWKDNFNVLEEDLACFIRSSYRPEERIACFEATIFHLEEGGWRRSDFTLKQRCYSETEILSALAEAGFPEIQACAGNLYKELIPLTGDTERGFFVCRKAR